MNENMKLDEFELRLEKMIETLQNCQQEKEKKSCYECEKLFMCDTRKAYVDSVYASMSKGQAGGFEF